MLERVECLPADRAPALRPAPPETAAQYVDCAERVMDNGACDWLWPAPASAPAFVRRPRLMQACAQRSLACARI